MQNKTQSQYQKNILYSFFLNRLDTRTVMKDREIGLKSFDTYNPIPLACWREMKWKDTNKRTTDEIRIEIQQTDEKHYSKTTFN